MISDSVLVMTVIDIVILSSVAYLAVVFHKHSQATEKLGLAVGIKIALLGLAVISLFYLVDLFTMYFLPILSSQEHAMEIMAGLHLNWNWITALVSVLMLTAGLSYLVQTLIPKTTAAIEKRELAEDKVRKLNLDLERRVIERTEVLQQIAQGTTAATGEEFFHSIVKHLADSLRVRWAFISELIDDRSKSVRLKAIWSGTGYGENFDYKTTGTPCENVMRDKFAFYPCNVQEIFPEDVWLRDQGVESYMAILLPDSDGNPIGHMGVMHDRPMKEDMPVEGILKIFATRAGAELQLKKSEKLLEEQAIHDTLTGLYNRRYFNSRMEKEITQADRNQNTLAILLCDLNQFKEINDTHGHQIGDQVLKFVAKNVQDATRGTDLAFRWGGDEFVVVLSNPTREGVLIAADRIRRGILKINQQGDFGLDVSIGVAMFPEHGSNTDDLIGLADRALYIAKKGGDEFHIGEEEYQLDESTIRVVFQPVMDIRMNQALGYEALGRDAQGKLSILDLFKKYQAIGKSNELKCLCFDLQLKKAGEIGLEKVFINVDFNVLRKLQPKIASSNMEVILEISEAEALYDIKNHLEIAKKWREHGYKFAIDDFGAGFISLPFIARLNPEHIKLDRSTVLQAVASKGFRRVLKDLLVGLRNCSTGGIIAEGIESARELQVVKDLDIYLVQGYLFGKPEELKREDGV